jgi:hypothetical protein
VPYAPTNYDGAAYQLLFHLFAPAPAAEMFTFFEQGSASSCVYLSPPGCSVFGETAPELAIENSRLTLFYPRSFPCVFHATAPASLLQIAPHLGLRFVDFGRAALPPLPPLQAAQRGAHALFSRFDSISLHDTRRRSGLTSPCSARSPVQPSLCRLPVSTSQPASDRPPRPCATGRRANAGASLAPSPRTGDS